MAKKKTHEWEFQGQVVSWLNEEIKRRSGLGLDMATQEPSKLRERSDLVVWWNRSAESAFLTVELKQPDTRISDPKFFNDAREKAYLWGSQYFALWNMQSAELYRNPKPPQKATPGDKIKIWEPDHGIRSVEDWLDPERARSLHKRAVEILDLAWKANVDKDARKISIDASLFVSRLANRVSSLHAEILPELKKKTKEDRNTRKLIRAISATQGFIGIIDDLESAIAGQFSYRLVGQILFYFALRRKQPSLKPFSFTPSDIFPEAFRPYWDDVRRYDYEALFEPSELDEIVPIPHPAQQLIKKLVSELSEYDWDSLRDDVLGSIFEHLIPKEQQLQYGQFYTPQRVADVLVAFAVDGSGSILDPGCGSGTFLMSAYDYLKWKYHLPHEDILSKIWGFDISPFAAELAAINLFRQNLSSFENFPRIVRDDYFDLRAGKDIMFPPVRVGSQEKVPVSIPIFDSIVGNPPYLRSQNQDDLDPKYKKKLFDSARTTEIKPTSKTDLFAFFIYKSLEFMKPGSRIGFVTSSSWLTANFGSSIQWLFFSKLKLIALISSSVESFFSQVDVNTVLIIAEKRSNSVINSKEVLRFVTLRRPLSSLITDHHDWTMLTELTDSIETSTKSHETENYRVTIVSTEKEKDIFESKSKQTLNWSMYLRAPGSYFNIYGEDNKKYWCELKELARVGLGFKSLQNNFYYLSKGTIETYKIESEFLESIFTMKDVSSKKYLQEDKGSSILFYCKSKRADLRGTGAYKYIQDMAKRPAAIKKQSGSIKTIEEVLSLQGSGDWYAPKAQSHKAHIWLRKAFSDVYSPFIFKRPVAFDQRSNFIIPHKKIEWEVLAAILTSSLSALSFESHGAASMGAGALEMATKKLPNIRIVDIRSFSSDEKKKLISLAKDVWEKEKPLNWTKIDKPGKHMQRLDKYILEKMDGRITSDQLYKELRETCSSRFLIAKDKVKTKKKNVARDLNAVADVIVDSVKPILNSKRFPEDFLVGNEKPLNLSFPLHRYLEISFQPLLAEASLSIKDSETGRTVLQDTYATVVADIIVRAIMIGRREFIATLDEDLANSALDEFVKWFKMIIELIEKGCASSSIGTKYEEALFSNVLTKLKFDPAIMQPLVFGTYKIK